VIHACAMILQGRLLPGYGSVTGSGLVNASVTSWYSSCKNRLLPSCRTLRQGEIMKSGLLVRVIIVLGAVVAGTALTPPTLNP
jgi:hypothetical protein